MSSSSSFSNKIQIDGGHGCCASCVFFLLLSDKSIHTEKKCATNNQTKKKCKEFISVHKAHLTELINIHSDPDILHDQKCKVNKEDNNKLEPKKKREEKEQIAKTSQIQMINLG